ncbi:MAG: GNAT family acetyltransferase [Lachnospiraceae bacterium]|nr:GNAT family acetyltransferase [Lachnospiraceae bacterium]
MTEYIPGNTIALNYIKKEPFIGSFKGMRYRLKNAGDDMEVCIWPEPYNFIKTKDELKQYAHFPLDADGKDAAVEWLNNQYEGQKELWDMSKDMPWV